MKRRSRKTSKFSINLPTSLVDNLDWLADQTETDRTDVITEILDAVMESGDLLDMIFGEALEDEDQDANADASATESANDDESEEEEEEEAESEE